MIIVLGHVHFHPSERSAFVFDVRMLARTRSAESGCLLFAAVEDDSPGWVLIVKCWRDEAALAAHVAAADIAAYLETWGGRLRSDLLKYDAADESAVTA